MLLAMRTHSGQHLSYLGTSVPQSYVYRTGSCDASAAIDGSSGLPFSWDRDRRNLAI